MTDERFERLRAHLERSLKYSGPGAHGQRRIAVEDFSSIEAELAETRRERDEFRELLLDKGMKVGTATTAALQAELAETKSKLGDLTKELTGTRSLDTTEAWEAIGAWVEETAALQARITELEEALEWAHPPGKGSHGNAIDDGIYDRCRACRVPPHETRRERVSDAGLEADLRKIRRWLDEYGKDHIVQAEIPASYALIDRCIERTAALQARITELEGANTALKAALARAQSYEGVCGVCGWQHTPGIPHAASPFKQGESDGFYSSRYSTEQAHQDMKQGESE